jgi:hypothetical protein
VTDELVLKIRDLDQERRIDQVPGELDPIVRLWLAQARSHLDAAPMLVQIGNRSLALEAIHQGCRVSLVAHLYAAGWRAVGQNNHALVVEYGRVALAEHFDPDELDRLDFIRRQRKDSDYGQPTRLSNDALSDLVSFAARIHVTIATNLPTRILRR